MNARSACVMGLILLGLAAAPAAAQEPGDRGLTVSAPSAIGFIWHMTPRVAIRPEVSFSITETDGEGSISDLRGRGVTLGASALFYTGRWDNLRTYVSPRLTYSWSSSTFQGGGSTFDSSSDAWGLAGSFGAQYSLGTRFAVFGEAGLQFSSSTSESPSLLGSIDRTTWNFGTRSQVGVTLYF